MPWSRSGCGMRDAGYKYIVIDDCWQVGRDKDGNNVVDYGRFPSGIKVLADYIHKKGLKFGIYSCAGSMTCQRCPGSTGYQIQDTRRYAEWGVDYLKYDWCCSEGQNKKIKMTHKYLHRSRILVSLYQKSKRNKYQLEGIYIFDGLYITALSLLPVLKQYGRLEKNKSPYPIEIVRLALSDFKRALRNLQTKNA